MRISEENAKKIRALKNKEAQEKRRNGLRSAGIELIELMLDFDTRKRLSKLCIKAGYRDPMVHRRNSAEAFSNVIVALAMKACGSSRPVPNTAESQRLYREFKVIKYLRNPGEQTGETTTKPMTSSLKIAEFMTKHSYPRPRHITGEDLSDTSSVWTEEDVDLMSDSQSVKELIIRCNHPVKSSKKSERT